jgi:di/tricarboxylate transporter
VRRALAGCQDRPATVPCCFPDATGAQIAVIPPIGPATNQDRHAVTFEIALLFGILTVVVYLFLTEKLPVDLTAFLCLVTLIFAGFIQPDEAFTGFASPAVITMLFIFVVGAALLHTGLADVVGGHAHRLAGGREFTLIIVIMVITGVLSAFMNNIAATAVLMPAVASLSRRAAIPPSRLFMPLSFGAILGGTTTMVGTPPNILAAAMLRERGIESFQLFTFTPIGLVLLAVGTLYMVTVGRRLLPDRGLSKTPAAGRDLAQLYNLEERLFSIRIPAPSRLDGVTLGEAQLGRALRSQVLAIRRHGHTQLAPGADTVLRSGDVLLTAGRLDDIQELFRVQGVEIQSTSAEALPPVRRGVAGIRLPVEADSALVGRNLRELHFRERHGAVVVGIERKGTIIQEKLGHIALTEGDRILAFGSQDGIARLAAAAEPLAEKLQLTDLERLAARFFMIRIPDGSPLQGLTLGASQLGQLVGLTVTGLVRGDETILGISPQEVLAAGDELLVGGDPEGILRVLELGEVRLDAEVEAAELESEDIGIVEATVAPRSQLAGRSLRALAFRERYGVQVMALWREGRPRRADLADLPLRFGDALLLQGPRDKLQLLARDPDLVVLTSDDRPPRRLDKAPVALGGLFLMIGLVVSGWQPIHVAAFAAATLILLGRALTMEEAYRAVEWRAIFLVAAILPVGMAMERTGAALLLAETVTELAGPVGPYALLAALVLLASLLSQALDGAPAVVLLTPVAFQIAEQSQIAPQPLLMGIALAASAAFMTPFSHKANLLVMGAGGYRALDYVKVGSPLTLVILALIVLLVPLVMPFQ